MTKRRIILGITGASGAIYGIRLLEVLRTYPEVETHLVITRSGGVTLRLECPERTLADVHALAHASHKEGDIAACIASGSFRTDAMVIAPCSMKSLAAIAHGFSDNLLTRSADVILKERRKLILLPRETPLHAVHLKNMLSVTELGGIIMPPVPGFYHRPQTLAELVDHTVGKVLDLLELEHQLFPAWTGPG